MSKLTESMMIQVLTNANQANADAWDDGFVDSYETAETYDDYFTSHRVTPRHQMFRRHSSLMKNMK